MKKTFLLLCLLAAFISCKKNTTTTSGGSSSNTTNSNIYPTNATSFYAFLWLTKNQNMSLGTHVVTTDYQGSAVFDSLPEPINSYNASAIKVDSVFFDNVFCQFDASSMTYYSPTPYDTLFAWRVVGNNKIHSFNFTKSNGIANYSNYNLLPDTIDRTHPITFPVNITNANNPVVTLNANGYNFTDTLKSGVTSATFSAAQMSMGNAGMGSITIQNSTSYAESVYGKPMQFAFFLYFEKQVYFK